jgi:hypothetical protein
MQHPTSWYQGLFAQGWGSWHVKLTYSPPSTFKFKNAWSYTSIHPYIFIAQCLIKHQTTFTFYLQQPVNIPVVSVFWNPASSHYIYFLLQIFIWIFQVLHKNLFFNLQSFKLVLEFKSSLSTNTSAFRTSHCKKFTKVHL